VTVPKNATRPRGRIQHIGLLLLGGLLCGLGDFATLALGLLHRLDNADGNSLSHVTDGETTKGRIFIVALNAHGLRRSELDDGGITGLDELGVRLHYLTRSAIDLLNQLAELAGNVCSVAIKNWCITSVDLSWVIEDDNLGSEGISFSWWIDFRISTNESSLKIFNGDVLNVKSDVISR
jgi:hypothetical protein